MNSVRLFAAISGHKRRASACMASIAVACAVNAAAAQSLGGAVDDDVSLWRVGGAFLLCIALGASAIFIVRGRAGYPQIPMLTARRARRLRLVESLRLGRQSLLSIVACDGEELLVLSSEQSAHLVGRLPLATKDAGLSSEARP
jgi:hypothetical protein